MKIFIGGLSTNVVTEDELKTRLEAAFNYPIPAGQLKFVNKNANASPNKCLITSRVLVYLQLDDLSKSQFKSGASMLNATNWRGCRIRVEEANPDFMEKLAEERICQDNTTSPLSARWAVKQERRIEHSSAHHADGALVPVKKPSDRPFWKKIAPGRLVRTMRLRMPSSGRYELIDPSKHNTVKNLYDNDDVAARTSITSLCWSKDENGKLLPVVAAPSIPAKPVKKELKSEYVKVESIYGAQPVDKEDDNVPEVKSLGRKVDLFAMRHTMEQTKIGANATSNPTDDQIAKNLTDEKNMAMSVLQSLLGDDPSFVKTSVEIAPLIPQTEQYIDSEAAIWKDVQRYDPGVSKELLKKRKVVVPEAPTAITEMKIDESQNHSTVAIEGKDYKIAQDLKSLFFGDNATAPITKPDSTSADNMFSFVEAADSMELDQRPGDEDLSLNFGKRSAPTEEDDLMALLAMAKKNKPTTPSVVPAKTADKPATLTSEAANELFLADSLMDPSVPMFFPHFDVNKNSPEVDPLRLYPRKADCSQAGAFQRDGTEIDVNKWWEKYRSCLTKDYKTRHKFAMKAHKRMRKPTNAIGRVR